MMSSRLKKSRFMIPDMKFIMMKIKNILIDYRAGDIYTPQKLDTSEAQRDGK